MACVTVGVCVGGSAGYEEAAAQGLVAGINAARVASNSPAVDFPRETSYIGTLVDDLITKVPCILHLLVYEPLRFH